MLKHQTYDTLVVLCMFGLLPVDMVNGILLHNDINLAISVGQLFKLFIITLITLRLLLIPKLIASFFFIFLLLLLPTIYQLLSGSSGVSLTGDVIKISKYLTPYISFLFFYQAIKRSRIKYGLLFKLFSFSYWVLILNILIKYLGIGYPIYENGNIGSKGFFYAGNELSALLLILSSILAFNIWKRGDKSVYYLFMALNLLAALTISSKTAILGVILVFLAIPLQYKSFNTKKLLYALVSVFILLPAAILLSWSFIKNTSLILRIQFFYDKFDFWTFLLSSRNTYLQNAQANYFNEYNILEKFIGVGSSAYESLNNEKIVEMDLIDIFFSYGFIGVGVFVLMMFFLLIQSRRLSKNPVYSYARLVNHMVIILLVISTLAGHVYGAGMPAIYLGLLFCFMYLKSGSFMKSE